ncbi:potassium transporter Kef, partial [Microbacterium oleivorans]
MGGAARVITRPGHLATAPAAPASPPRVEGMDLDLAGRNVAAAGGAPRVFAASFAAGLAEAPDTDPV